VAGLEGEMEAIDLAELVERHMVVDAPAEQSETEDA